MRRVDFSSSLRTRMEEPRETGRELGAAREEISWATLKMICEEGVPAFSNSAWKLWQPPAFAPLELSNSIESNWIAPRVEQ